MMFFCPRLSLELLGTPGASAEPLSLLHNGVVRDLLIYLEHSESGLFDVYRGPCRPSNLIHILKHCRAWGARLHVGTVFVKQFKPCKTV